MQLYIWEADASKAPEGHSHCSIEGHAMERLPCPLAHSARLSGFIKILRQQMVDRGEIVVPAPNRA